MGEGTATGSQARRRRIIERPRLTRLLDESQGRIKMLVAPAGYGKTTLARQWLEGKVSSWYTATSASTDVAALAAGLCSATTVVVAGAGDALVQRLPVTPRPEDEAALLAGMLAQDLKSWPSNAWLVLDDYQAIAGPPAEQFVETLFLEAPLNILLMSRRRPGWASSRRILYGEVSELDRAALAMNYEEAHELLSGAGAAASELVDLAQGWPAVLALAAVSDSELPDLTAAPHLYGFFADEIYRRIDRRGRRVLCELALYNTAGLHLALGELRPEVAEHVVAVGVDNGFLTERHDRRLDMHPLLRAFLQRKLREESAEISRQSIERAARVLMQHELWDEAFELMRGFDQEQLIPVLVASSMDELLAAGRVATLRGWIAHASQDAPVVRLATAELAFREGRYFESEALAELAAADLTEHPDLVARANLVAGRAAHVASREEQARAFFRRAQTVAQTPELVRKAALGEIVAAIELEDADAPELLRVAASHRSMSPEDQVTMADRTLAFETRFGHPVNLQAGLAAWQLLRLVADPVARSSFRNVLGYALASSAKFAQATAITEEQIDDAERCRLDFVIPYALAIKGLLCLCQRAYSEGEELLDEAEDRALTAGDQAAYQVASAVRMRIYIAQAAFDLAIERRAVDPIDATRSLRAELCATHALAFAGVGKTRQARELANSALEMSIGFEGTVTAKCALAVVAIRAGDHAHGLTLARDALYRSSQTGMIECFVSAYRGFPELIVSLLEDHGAHDELSSILSKVGDADSQQGRGQQHSVMSLSPREKEVLSLLAQGLSNAAIGTELFISPVTVKVHVRHIFEKLGVTSRAAATLRATQLNRF